MPNPKIEWILKTDIEALSDLVGNVCALHFRLDRTQELSAALERMRSLVNDLRWQRKITYHQALLLDGVGEEAQAKKEFAKLGAIDPETESDVEILQAYLDLFGDEQSFSEKNAICDRILALSRSTSDLVQYRVVKAMTYAGVGDWGEAQKQVASAIAHARMKEQEKPLDVRTRLLLASGLSFLGLLTSEVSHFVEAERYFKALLADQDRWSVEGRARLLDHLGECYRYWGKWREGGHAYSEALSLHPSGIRSVFFAECEMHDGRKDKAASILDEVDFATLSAAEQIDFAYALAELAVERSDRGRLKGALTMLEGVRATEPYFEQRRLSFIVEVQADLAHEPSSSMWQTLKEVLQSFNHYLLLRPNFMGFGIDLNAMIADSLEPKGKNDD